MNTIEKNSSILVTGAAGFIGYHLSSFIMNKGYKVIGIDNMNSYYDMALKNARLTKLSKSENFIFHKTDLNDKNELNDLFKTFEFDYVINLAAQAGVRYSITNPFEYIESNIKGFLNILEACIKHPVKHLLYASSSSVYGANKNIPFAVNHNVDHPVSLYAATKKSNELMAHAYSYLYKLPTTGLRFFTVYGPWGRPDMAYYTFTKKILAGESIDVYNYGNMERDFTYVDDIVEAMFRLLSHVPKPMFSWDETNEGVSRSSAPYRIFNVGNNNPVKLETFIMLLENKLGKKAVKNYKDIQQGDVLRTYADISDLENEIGFRPYTNIEHGLSKFVDWYLDFYKNYQ